MTNNSTGNVMDEERTDSNPTTPTAGSPHPTSASFSACDSDIITNTSLGTTNNNNITFNNTTTYTNTYKDGDDTTATMLTTNKTTDSASSSSSSIADLMASSSPPLISVTSTTSIQNNNNNINTNNNRNGRGLTVDKGPIILVNSMQIEVGDLNDEEGRDFQDDSDIEKESNSNNNNMGDEIENDIQQLNGPMAKVPVMEYLKRASLRSSFTADFMDDVVSANVNSDVKPNELTLNLAGSGNNQSTNGDGTPIIYKLSDILGDFKEIYNFLYVGDLNSLFTLKSIQLNENQRIRCLGFDSNVELSSTTQRFFQYQIIEFESETDILSITKQFDHFSQLILGRGPNTPVVIHECCFGLILASIYLIKYELFSLPQANDLIGYHDFLGTSQKHSHFQKVDSCTLIGDITSYYYRNITKRVSKTTKPQEQQQQQQQEEETETTQKKPGFFKKLFTKKEKPVKTPTTTTTTTTTTNTKEPKNNNKQSNTSNTNLSNNNNNNNQSPVANTTTAEKPSSQQQQQTQQQQEDDIPNIEVLVNSKAESAKPIIIGSYKDLPDEYKELVKKWSVKLEDVEKNWDVALGLLHFQSKMRFYSSQQKLDEHNLYREERKKHKHANGASKSPDRGSDEGNSTISSLSQSQQIEVKQKLVAKYKDWAIDFKVAPYVKKPSDQLIKKAGSDIKKLYSIKERVGKGGFGSVYSARNNVTKKRIAIKKLPHTTSKEKRFNVRELRVLDFCKHKNIISYNEAYLVGGDELWAVMEFMDGGTLAEASTQYPFQESNIAYVAAEMLQGLHYLHSHKLVHRDLKSQNIMMTPSGEIKLIDFGLCSNMSSEGKIRMCGSPLWMPPEMIQQKPHTYSTDIWSMAVCLLELANRAHKLRKDPIKVMFMVGTEGIKEPFEDPNRWSDNFHDFIRSCLAFDPSKRPTAFDLLSHPFIAQQDTKGKMANILSSVFLKNIVGI